MPEADRAGVACWAGAPKRCAHAQNIFVARGELDVALEPDDGLVARAIGVRVLAEERRTEVERRGRARARARRGRASPRRATGAVSWRPIGSPASSNPHGTLIAGTPARFAGIVKMSFRYIAIGSSAFSPIRNAVVGDVGDDEHVEPLERRLVVADRPACAPSAPGRSTRRSSPADSAYVPSMIRRFTSGPNALPARREHHRDRVGGSPVGAEPVADAVVAGEVRRRLARRDQVVGATARTRRAAATTSPTSAPSAVEASTAARTDARDAGLDALAERLASTTPTRSPATPPSSAVAVVGHGARRATSRRADRARRCAEHERGVAHARA